MQVASPGSPDGRNRGKAVEAPHDLADVQAGDCDAIVLPGGQINRDILRTTPEAVQLVMDCVAQGRIVAAICHGPWLLV